MSFESLMQAVQRLNASADALAALGAELRLRRDGTEADPMTRKMLQGLVHSIDPAVLQTIGKMSTRIVHQIQAFSAQCPDLHSTLRSPGTFLDIGTGVGWLAIEAAQVWPALNVVGIDIWEPSLQLARANIVASGAQARVALRSRNVVDLDDEETFSVVWYPAPFLPLHIAATAMQNACRALIPGGWLIFGIFPPQPDPLGEALTALRVVRCGGHPWTLPEVETRLHELGLEKIETYLPGSVSMLVFGRKPG